jgi:uncharacterized sulfatase
LASEGPDREQTDGKIATEITQLLETHRDRPFFLACGFFRPHTPYVAPKAYFEKYPLSEFTLPVVPAGHRNAGPDAAFGSHRKEHDLLTEKLTREALQAYYASTSFMDAQLGRVLDTLERLNLKQKTIVVFFSDHGYHLGEHGLWQKMSLWENSARVPLVIYDPRAAGNGQACSRTVELVDLHATLADLCGLTAPKTDGQSLKPLLDNPSAAWDKPAITQVSRGTPVATGEVRPKRQGWFMGYSVRNERYRYTEWDGGSKGVQLHDLEADPNEWSNLAADPRYQETLASLKKYIPSRRNHD